MMSKYTIYIIVITILSAWYLSGISATHSNPIETSDVTFQKKNGIYSEQDTATVTDVEAELIPPDIMISEPISGILPVFVTSSLILFNGEDPSLPIYVAFEGNVYDVSEGKKFYGPDGHYHFLAGKDGTKLLKVFGGDIIKKKYPIIGTLNP